MKDQSSLTPEKRGTVTEIQDLLIDRYVELKEALDRGEKARTREIEAEITELRREKDKITECAALETLGA